MFCITSISTGYYFYIFKNYKLYINKKTDKPTRKKRNELFSYTHILTFLIFYKNHFSLEENYY